MKTHTLTMLLVALVSAAVVEGPAAGAKPATGPLRVCPTNRRYFAGPDGKAVYLTGAHTWNNLVDIGASDPPPRFDYPKYLDFLAKNNHNFIRLWTWESVTWNTKRNGRNAILRAAPHPWARTGQGKAADGKPKFDLDKFNAEYFRRLRQRVAAAQKRGIYVSVMLFEGWAMQFSAGAWTGHPFHRANNVNGINGDANRDGKGLEIHTLTGKPVTRVQEAYVRKVIDTVNDLDNVLYEISNENHPASTEWQAHVIDLIHRAEKAKPKQHPVGMTFQYRGGSNKTLFASPADWVSPNPSGGWRDNPPAADGGKVVITDTDHLWGIGGNRSWVWKSFLRGANPIFMDPYRGVVLSRGADTTWQPIRQSMGHTLNYARRMNLTAMTPQGKLASSGYCLARAAGNAEYLVYVPRGRPVTVDLSAASSELAVEWFDVAKGKVAGGKAVRGGAKRTLTPPFRGEAVLYLRSRKGL